TDNNNPIPQPNHVFFNQITTLSTKHSSFLHPPTIPIPKINQATMGNDEQVAAMKEAFTLFDTDGDGKIAPSELGILMRSLGGNPTQAQLKSIIAEEKLTSPFDFNRFTELMGKHLKPEPFDRQLRDAFKVIDKDGTGFVVVADLKHILTSIGEKLEPSEFDEWIKEIDVGSDGKIKYEDFIARMVAK
ncbi:probable calcium-binding protein CML13, partial [Helianthus annuus]